MDNLDTETNKVCLDCNQELRELWLSGNRDWEIYSKDKFRQFWTVRQSEVHLKK